jgi:hypothetical protein
MTAAQTLSNSIQRELLAMEEHAAAAGGPAEMGRFVQMERQIAQYERMKKVVEANEEAQKAHAAGFVEQFRMSGIDPQMMAQYDKLQERIRHGQEKANEGMFTSLDPKVRAYRLRMQEDAKQAEREQGQLYDRMQERARKERMEGADLDPNRRRKDYHDELMATMMTAQEKYAKANEFYSELVTKGILNEAEATRLLRAEKERLTQSYHAQHAAAYGSAEELARETDYTMRARWGADLAPGGGRRNPAGLFPGGLPGGLFPGQQSTQEELDNSVPLNNDLTQQTNRLLEQLVNGQRGGPAVMAYVG